MKRPKVRGKVEIPFTVLTEEVVGDMLKHPMEAMMFLTGMMQDLTSLLFQQVVHRTKEDQDLALKLAFRAMQTQYAELQRDLERAKKEQEEDKAAGKEPEYTQEAEAQAEELTQEYLGKIMKGGVA